jgi:hypothetical protein
MAQGQTDIGLSTGRVRYAFRPLHEWPLCHVYTHTNSQFYRVLTGISSLKHTYNTLVYFTKVKSTPGNRLLTSDFDESHIFPARRGH